MHVHPCSSSCELYGVTSKTRNIVNGLGTSGCHWYSDLGHTTSISVAFCLLKLKLYAALVFWSPQSIVTYSSEKNYRCRASPHKPIPLPHVDDPATVDLSVIVPTYNEVERMPKMLDAAIKHILSVPKRKTEVLIVDDGSSDGTIDLALEYAKRNPKVEIRVIAREKNSGKGGAVRHGMLHSRGKRLLMVDADGASRFEDMELLWAALDRLGENDPDHSAIAIGSRAHLVKTEVVVKVWPLHSPYSFVINGIAALVPTKPADVWFPHNPPRAWCWSYPRYPVRIQTFHQKSCATNLPKPTLDNLDLRRRNSAPCQDAEHSGGRGVD